MSDPIRTAFEAWISAPPYERDVARFSEDENKSAWPGQYKDCDVQLASDAWLEALTNHQNNVRIVSVEILQKYAVHLKGCPMPAAACNCGLSLLLEEN